MSFSLPPPPPGGDDDVKEEEMKLPKLPLLESDDFRDDLTLTPQLSLLLLDLSIRMPSITSTSSSTFIGALNTVGGVCRFSIAPSGVDERRYFASGDGEFELSDAYGSKIER